MSGAEKKPRATEWHGVSAVEWRAQKSLAERGLRGLDTYATWNNNSRLLLRLIDDRKRAEYLRLGEGHLTATGERVADKIAEMAVWVGKEKPELWRQFGVLLGDVIQAAHLDGWADAQTGAPPEMRKHAKDVARALMPQRVNALLSLRRLRNEGKLPARDGSGAPAGRRALPVDPVTGQELDPETQDEFLDIADAACRGVLMKGLKIGHATLADHWTLRVEIDKRDNRKSKAVQQLFEIFQVPWVDYRRTLLLDWTEYRRRTLRIGFLEYRQRMRFARRLPKPSRRREN